MTRFKELLGVERVRRFAQACVCTAYLKDSDKPVSFILVAEPESAKTETLKMVSEPAGKRRPIHFYNFATAYGIQKDLLAKIQSGELRFLFSSDLQAVTGMSPKTRAQLMTFLIGIIEEGFKASHSYAVHFDSEVAVKVGWGATVQPSYLWATDKNRNRVMRKWIQSGFASRVMFFSYSYSPEIVQQIFDRQSSGYSALAEPLRLPTKDYPVSVPQKFDLALQQYAKMIAQDRGDYGIRAHRDLRQLAKALALMRALDAKQRGEDVDLNSVEVDFGDMAELNDIFQYLNFDCNLIDQDYPLPGSNAEEVAERLGPIRSSPPATDASEIDQEDDAGRREVTGE